MTKPSPSLLNQQSLHVLGVCDVMQVFVGDFVRPGYLHYLSQTGVRDRPFNLKGGGGGLWFFVSFRIFFRTTQEFEYFFYFCSAKREFFFQKLTLDYMTKTLNQIIFFPPPKLEYCFRKTTITPPSS